MKNPLTRFAKFVAEKVYKYFGKDSGNMLLATSMIGIFTSCLAQTGAILLNKKYTDSQKMFMAPQELTEGCITVLSMFLVTKPIQKFSSKCFKSGKLLSKEMVEYLRKNELLAKRGEASFDFVKSVDGVIKKVKESDTFIKSGSLEKEKLLEEHLNILQEFNAMSDAASAIATTFAGVTSTALISPLLRNHVASRFQKASLEYLESESENSKPNVNFNAHRTINHYSGMNIGRI